MTPDQLAAAMVALGYGAYVPVALAVIGLAAKLDAIIPPAPATAPLWLRVLRRGLDLLGGNWGFAANANPTVVKGQTT